MPLAFITGLSLISPAGADAEAAWQACLECRCAGEDAHLPAPMQRVPLARLKDPSRWKDDRWPEPTAALAVAAAHDALNDAGLGPSHMARAGSAIVAATSKGGVLSVLAEHAETLAGRKGTDSQTAGGLWRHGSPDCALSALCQALTPGGMVSSIVAACASGLAAVAHGARLIARNEADTVLVVAADASIHDLFAGSFWRLGVLGTWQNHPSDACRPFCIDRTGFVLAEGSGAVVLQAAPDRRTRAISVAGWATGCQSADMIRSGDNGQVQAAVVRTALAKAGWPAASLDTVHAHATGTMHGDMAESGAIAAALGSARQSVPVLATKPITGHMLGAAGLAQVVLSVKAMLAGVVPPAANWHQDQQDPTCQVLCSGTMPRPARSGKTVCLASGFGGTVAAVALERTG